MLQATFKATFTHKGNDRHVYTVTGTPEELAEFKDAEGEYYAEDDKTGTPLYYTNFRSVMDVVPLKKSERTGRFNLDERELQSAITKVNSIGGVVGQAMANQLATALMPDSVKKIIEKAKPSEGVQADLFPAEPQSGEDLTKS